MSTHNVDNNTLSTAEISDPLVPIYPDKTPILWDGNYAHIDGMLYEVGRFYKRTGVFQMLLKHRAVALLNGRIAVEAYETVWFTSGKVKDTLKDPSKSNHDFDDPCPPTAIRFANAIASAAAAGTPAPTKLSKMPAEVSGNTVLSAPLVEIEDSKLLKSLNHVFGHAETSDDIIDAADGSGYNLIVELRAKAAEATPTDKALVSAEHANIIRNGVTGELTLASLKAFEKKYLAATRNLAPTSRPPDEAAMEMYSLIGLKDPSTRQVFEIKLQTEKPGSSALVLKSLYSLLRSRARSEQIDQVSSGGALVVKDSPPPDELNAILSRAAPNLTDAQLESLKAAIAGLRS